MVVVVVVVDSEDVPLFTFIKLGRHVKDPVRVSNSSTLPTRKTGTASPVMWVSPSRVCSPEPTSTVLTESVWLRRHRTRRTEGLGVPQGSVTDPGSYLLGTGPETDREVSQGSVDRIYLLGNLRRQGVICLFPRYPVFKVPKKGLPWTFHSSLNRSETLVSPRPSLESREVEDRHT